MKPNNIRAEEIELYVTPGGKDSGLKNSQSQKVFVQSREDSPAAVAKGLET